MFWFIFIGNVVLAAIALAAQAFISILLSNLMANDLAQLTSKGIKIFLTVGIPLQIIYFIFTFFLRNWIQKNNLIAIALPWIPVILFSLFMAYVFLKADMLILVVILFLYLMAQISVGWYILLPFIAFQLKGSSN